MKKIGLTFLHVKSFLIIVSRMNTYYVFRFPNFSRYSSIHQILQHRFIQDNIKTFIIEIIPAEFIQKPKLENWLILFKI